MSDEQLYARVVEELQAHGPLPGLWAKSYAEAEGEEGKAKALYLKYRVEQLAQAEAEQKCAAKAEAQHQRDVLSERDEYERRARAKAEGRTPIHYVLWGLVLLFLLLGVIRAFGA